MKSVLSNTILISGALLFSSCSHNLAPAGHYQDEPVTIDGKMNDWVLPLRFSNPEYSMHYSVTNDDKNIYICVYSKDAAFQKRILRGGMSIYFDTKGEKNKNIALVFPVKKPAAPGNNGNGNPMLYPDYKTTMDQLLFQSDYYNTIGFVNMENGQYDVNARQNNIQVAIQLGADSSLVYEAAVPISYVLGKDLTSGTVSKNFSVGITLDAESGPPGNSRYPSHASHGGGTMGGMHGMNGNRNYGQTSHGTQKAEENWYAFRLVYKKPT
jgi:hypothetical protein